MEKATKKDQTSQITTTIAGEIKNNLNTLVEKILTNNKDNTCLETVIEACEELGIEPDSVSGLLDPKYIEQIKIEVNRNDRYNKNKSNSPKLPFLK